ncbi:hypothetical protein KOR42_34860 [Thalassoglobus neptunius]|uniref:Uncharacterized protein n=1 Tax=Thalassoglobus neptunius TaxID=1938619 RepID=A0A5C5WLQ9_9PLAN|nr:hypothetical protein [Thalassoglobus neptunius]TWT51598.1 hypothetical protein KOR42_34860 [Thalassoglobus neptunius]
MFGLFGGKDWNIIAVIFERRDLYTVSGQRVKGGGAEKARDGAKRHPRTIYWAVFDQKGSYLEGGEGAGSINIPGDVLKKLKAQLAKTGTVLEILKSLETKQADKLAKPLVWAGYPPREMHGQD